MKIITLDSPFARRVGFLRSRFVRGSYLCLEPEKARVIIGLISARRPGRGDFRRLIQQLRAHGFAVAVPQPQPRMKQILRKNGFRRRTERNEFRELTSLWTLPRSRATPANRH